MRQEYRKRLQGIACVVISFCGAVAYAGAVENSSPDNVATDAVLTCLLDTGVPSADPLPENSIAARTGWILLKEDGLTHAFHGDAVLLNDKLAVVLRQKGHGAEVYTLTGTGPSFRALLSPRPAGGGAVESLDSLRIVENNPGAVSVRATFNAGEGKSLTLTYRVTLGQITVQMEPDESVDALRVEGQTDYIVAPDFFADDLVYSGRSSKEPQAGLPAENFFLHLMDGGDAIATCVWQTNGRNARALFSGEGVARAILGSEIECAAGKLVWVAFAEKPASWHADVISPEEGEGNVALQWTPAFPAKWRGNFVSDSEVARSWNFMDAPVSEYEAPGLGAISYPCRFQDGAPFVCIPKPEASAGRKNTDVLLVVYPIDRSQATPLDMFVLVDVMRGTLGVGPCQYALDLEGLDAESSPTPALVLEWVERLFKKKRVEKDATVVRERLSAMAAHVEHAEQRIARYAVFAAGLRDSSAAKATDSGELQTILSAMEASVRELEPARKSQQRVNELAERVVALTGKHDWEEHFRPIRDELCAIGSAQDRTLATCRMTLRRLKQRCLAQADGDPGAGEMLKQIDELLREGG